ncbi:hypothetical protein PMAYCL1PPCAC_11728 [Pristionchus mayeri]|uniref:Ig-like domain-containing protein n=1 Tax=Pristionchus mayeri TaxID=1317129 RepID=A0AAN4ZN23_9BILA|nr:hypothetical protein PMAYCL1PPCAC_11728 [Pristionchus mayeri]
MLLPLVVLAIASSPIISAEEATCKHLTDGPKLEFADAIGAKHNVAAGGRLELACTVLAAPTASIVWLHDGKEVQMNEGPQDYLLSSSKRLGISMLESRLVRECASAEDAGTYTCVAMSPCAKGIQQSAVVRVQGKASSSCSSSSAAPYIALHTYSRMELPTVPVQLVCRSSNEFEGVHWERVADDDSTTPLSLADVGFLQLASGDLIIDPQALSAADGEEIVSVTMRCHVGDTYIDSSVIFMEDE